MKWISRISGLILLLALSAVTHDCIGMNSRGETNQSRDDAAVDAISNMEYDFIN
jgi:hypothetical protein